VRPDLLAELVLAAVEKATAPMRERLAVAEAERAALRERLDALAATVPALSTLAETVHGVSERITVAEYEYAAREEVSAAAERIAATAAHVEHAQRQLQDHEVALASLHQRIVALDALAGQRADLEALRDRVIAQEAASRALAARPTEDPPPAVARTLGALDARVDALGRSYEALEAMRDRVAALEARGQTPAAREDAGGPALERMLALEARVAALAPIAEALIVLRERVAAIDGRPGPVGPPGADGAPGKDGADGLGWDDLASEYDGERTITLTVTRGARTKTIGTYTLPLLILRGVYTEGTTYQPYDVVKWARGAWVCLKETIVQPTRRAPTGPQGKDFWFPLVEPGRDGKDGKDGAVGQPGPPGKDWQQVFDEGRRQGLAK